MILIDTSVWVDYLRSGDEDLTGLLLNSRVLAHPFITGEIACGHLGNRREILALLGDLPEATVAADTEVLYFIEQHRIMGRGIGYIDSHLLASTALAGTVKLWTRDKRLGEVASELGLAFGG